MKNAIVALTRGYPEQKNLYDELLQRNKSIYEHINKKRDYPADIILFHEGNISEKDQSYLTKESPEPLKFINVSKYFEGKNLKLNGESKFDLSYRNMCRFNMFHIWNEVSEYDYILRVDEDIELKKFNPSIFEFMNLKNINYLTGRFTKDTHELTNSTLPQFLMKNTELDIKKIYNHRNPYTNLFATKVNFWKQNDIYSILEKISLSDEQLINRWGDHTVQGILLNYKEERIRLFPKLEYRHISHDLIIKNNFVRNLTINSKFNPISIKESFFKQILLKIKTKISNNKSYPKYDFRNY